MIEAYDWNTRVWCLSKIDLLLSFSHLILHCPDSTLHAKVSILYLPAQELNTLKSEIKSYDPGVAL